MATLLSFFLMFILVLLAHPRTSAGFICESTSCEIGGLPIQFPFWLRQANQSQLCGYPGFELSCNNSTNGQPLITLPESGDFVVKLLSLESQKIWINDPEECLVSRFMRNHGLNLEVSPFRLSDYYTIVDYSFLNCPFNLTSSLLVEPISCLNLSSNNKNNNNNHVNYSVVAVLSDPPFSTPWTSSCDLISTASIPVSDMVSLFWVDYYSDIQLEWDNPNCGSCEVRGGRCGFLGDPPFNVACYDLPNQSQGLSRKAKYGISMGVGIPGLLGIIGLACFFCGKRNRGDQLRQTSTELSTLITARPSVVVMGLDGAAIERYPKTQLGESGRLPKLNDNICSICLCEYQPKEMLRTIPECNHYFHATCIDGWLKMNATCPLCRNLPESSSSFTRSLLVSPAS